MLRRTSSQQTDLCGVLVEAQLGDTKAACSGLMFAGGRLVLTHGALLTAIKCPNKPERRGQLLTPPNIATLQLHVLHDTQRASRCSLDAWWICPLLVSTAKDLHFEGWRFNPEDEAEYESLGMMLVLAVDSSPKLDVRAALGQLVRDHVYTGTAAVGNRVRLESTPFGSAALFLNAWTQGTISAVSGEQNSMLLCDVHAAPGSEGGALYLKDQDNARGRLLGLAVLPFSVVRGEAVALCLCVALAPMLNRLLGQNGPLPAITSVSESRTKGVALLRHGSSWASAVSVDSNKGLFLTCSHVLQGKGETSLQWPGSGKPRRAEIVFRTTPDTAFDLAVLRIKGQGPPAPKPAAPVKGEDVLVAGYGVLTPPPPHHHEGLQGPLVSGGCVSLTRPHMLQTTCVVQSGASGGAVLRATSGELLGIVVGHMRALDAHPLPRDWPRLNFAVPVAAIAPALQVFLRSGDVSVLRTLEVPDEAIQRLWRLEALQIAPSKL